MLDPLPEQISKQQESSRGVQQTRKGVCLRSLSRSIPTIPIVPWRSKTEWWRWWPVPFLYSTVSIVECPIDTSKQANKPASQQQLSTSHAPFFFSLLFLLRRPRTKGPDEWLEIYSYAQRTVKPGPRASSNEWAVELSRFLLPSPPPPLLFTLSRFLCSTTCERYLFINSS